MPTTLITGGSGFIGVRLAARLQALGERVVLLDRRFAPEAMVGLAADIEAIEGDTTNFEGVRRVVAAVKPDGIVHLAAILSGQSEGDPALVGLCFEMRGHFFQEPDKVDRLPMQSQFSGFNFRNV